jgi:hypothetical protein
MFDPDRHIADIARSEPPRGHMDRVLARSGPGAVAPAPRGVPWRWAMPVAATLLVVAGVWWQSDRASRMVWFDLPDRTTHWTGKGVDVPVLPPEAYWAMSAFEEFERLRPSPPRTRRRDRAQIAEPALLEPDPAILAYWTPRPSTLEPIVIDDITPAPIDIGELAPIEPIDVAPIVIEPIEISQIAGDER